MSPLLLLISLMDFLVSLKFVEQNGQVPLLEVASFVTRVQDVGLRVEVHAADREEYRFSVFIIRLEVSLRFMVVIIIIVRVARPDLLQLVMEPLPDEVIILKWTGNDSVEVKVAIHV